MKKTKTLTADYIKEKGVNFNKKLYWSYTEDQESDQEGSLFTGISYELYPNGKIKEYMHVENGIIHGQKVVFYPDGLIKRIHNLSNGVLQGKQKYYDQYQNLKREEEVIAGYIITYTEYDENGKIIARQEKPDSYSLTNALKHADNQGKKMLKKYIKNKAM